MIWSVADLQTLRAIRVGSSEAIYAFVGLEGEPSGADEALLDEEERARAARFVRPVDRRRFVLAHAALRLFLARALGVESANVRYENDVHGKPRLRAERSTMEFNMSHSGELTMLAVARGRPIGVDVEQVRAMPDALSIAESHFSAAEGEALRSLPPAERQPAFFRCWTRKEAVVKGAGEGLRRPLNSFDIDLATGSQPFLLRFADETVEWALRDLQSPPGYVAAGAVAVVAGASRTAWRELSIEGF